MVRLLALIATVLAAGVAPAGFEAAALVNAIGQQSGLANGRHAALDLGVVCSLRF